MKTSLNFSFEHPWNFLVDVILMKHSVFHFICINIFDIYKYHIHKNKKNYTNFLPSPITLYFIWFIFSIMNPYTLHNSATPLIHTNHFNHQKILSYQMMSDYHTHQHHHNTNIITRSSTLASDEEETDVQCLRRWRWRFLQPMTVGSWLLGECDCQLIWPTSQGRSKNLLMDDDSVDIGWKMSGVKADRFSMFLWCRFDRWVGDFEIFVCLSFSIAYIIMYFRIDLHRSSVRVSF